MFEGQWKTILKSDNNFLNAPRKRKGERIH